MKLAPMPSSSNYAQLIAERDALLAALKRAEALILDNDYMDGLAVMRAAIAKAEEQS